MLSVSIEGEEVNQRDQTMGDQNQGTEKNLQTNVKCWSCGEKGHFRVDCTKRKQNHKSENDDDSMHLAEDIRDALILSVDSSIESWILDSSVSVHSSPNKELFQNFKSESFEKVYLANNKDSKIEGKGDVCIKTSAGNQWTLKDVRYISGL